MKGIIRTGGRTTGGGIVLSESANMQFGGVGIARQGDQVKFPVLGHGRTVIAEGHPVFKDYGAPIVFQGHRCACGCALISSPPESSAS